MEILVKLLKLKSPTFDGAQELLQYEHWKRKIEGLLEVLECPANYMVKLAAHLFKKDACFLWHVVKPKEGEAPLTLAQFKGLLDEKYNFKEVK